MSMVPEVEPLKDVLPKGRDNALEALNILQQRASEVPGEHDPADFAPLFEWLRKIVVAQYAVHEEVSPDK